MLRFQKITEDVEHSDFCCGNPGIEEQVRGAYYASLLREGYAYEIQWKAETDETAETLGYYMIRLVELPAERIPEEEQDFQSEVYAKRTFTRSAAEITFLAIAQAVQGMSLGRIALKQIMGHILMLSEQLPIRYIVLHALLEKVQFYLKRGFQPLGEAEGETQFMYFDCLQDRDPLDAYLERFQ